MAKKKFEIGYSMMVYCEVTVEAETAEEAEKMFENGDVQTSLDADNYDSDFNTIDYVREAEEEE